MRRTASLLVVVVFLSALPAWLDAQRPGQPPFGATATDPQFERRRQPEPGELEREREMEKRRNESRHKALQEDTDKLLQLATELKESVDESSENKLSLEVIRKAEEIEKLARRVRNRMRGN